MSLVRLILPIRVSVFSLVCLFLGGNCCAQAIEARANAAVESETILSGLNRPTGIAMVPGGAAQKYSFLVAEQGAGRVIRWNNVAPDEVVEVINGLEANAISPSSTSMGLRLGICFHGRQQLLVVGDTSASEGFALLFDLPADGEIQSAAHPKQRLDRTAGTGGKFGQFCDMAGGKHTIYLATASTEGNVFRADARSTVLGDFKPLIELGELAGPLALALNPQPHKGYLAVTRNTSSGSLLTIHDPGSGKELLETATGLQQIVTLAYSPKSGRLYAAKSDGIYRLDAEYRNGQPNCRAVLMAKCPQPTSMVFAPDGSLMVSALGELDAAEKSQGVVIKLQGNL